jgi:hypothetical protein
LRWFTRIRHLRPRAGLNVRDSQGLPFARPARRTSADNRRALLSEHEVRQSPMPVRVVWHPDPPVESAPGAEPTAAPSTEQAAAAPEVVVSVDPTATPAPTPLPAPVPEEAVLASEPTVRMWFSDGTELVVDEHKIDVTRMRDIAATMMWRSRPEGSDSAGGFQADSRGIPKPS